MRQRLPKRGGDEFVGVVKSRDDSWEASFPMNRIDKNVRLPCFDIGIFGNQTDAAR